jgi:hypothetical protein
MQVHQRGTSATGMTVSGYYSADRWRTAIGAAMATWTQTVENDAPTGSGLSKSLKVLCTTAAESPPAAGFTIVQQRLEGQDVQRVKKGTALAEQLTLSFWVKSNVTGTYVADIFDQDNTRVASATYQVSSSATWERKVITFPSDATGAFNSDAEQSLEVNWWLTAGSDRNSGTLGTTWASASNINRAVGQTNVAAATNNYWQITGVQLETGPVATPFEFEPYGTTLGRCQRYYYLHAGAEGNCVGVGGYYSATYLEVVGIQFPTTMRTAPSLVIATGTNYYRAWGNGGSDDLNSFTIADASVTSANLYNNTEANGTIATIAKVVNLNAAASVAFSAEM